MSYPHAGNHTAASSIRRRVGLSGGIGMGGIPVAHAPVTHRFGLGRIRVDAEDDFGPLRVAVAERAIAGAHVMRRPVDWVEVHRRLHRRELLTPLQVALGEL